MTDTNISDLSVDLLGMISALSGNKDVKKVNRKMYYAYKSPTAMRIRRENCVDKINEYCPDILDAYEELKEYSKIHNRSSRSLTKKASAASTNVKNLLQDTLNEGNVDPFLMLMGINYPELSNRVMKFSLAIALRNDDVTFFMSTISTPSIDSEGVISTLIDTERVSVSSYDIGYNLIRNFLTKIPITNAIKWIERFKKSLPFFEGNALTTRLEIFIHLVYYLEQVELPDIVVENGHLFLIDLRDGDVRNSKLSKDLINKLINMKSKGDIESQYSADMSYNINRAITVDTVVSILKDSKIRVVDLFKLISHATYGGLAESVIRRNTDPANFITFINTIRSIDDIIDIFNVGLHHSSRNKAAGEKVELSFVEGCKNSRTVNEFVEKALSVVATLRSTRWINDMMTALQNQKNSQYPIAFLEALLFRFYCNSIEHVYLESKDFVVANNIEDIHKSMTELLEDYNNIIQENEGTLEQYKRDIEEEEEDIVDDDYDNEDDIVDDDYDNDDDDDDEE